MIDLDRQNSSSTGSRYLAIRPKRVLKGAAPKKVGVFSRGFEHSEKKSLEGLAESDDIRKMEVRVSEDAEKDREGREDLEQESETPPAVETGGAPENFSLNTSDVDSKVQIRIAQVFEDNLIEGPAARLLAIVLCWRMDDDDETTVTRKELADKIGSSAKTVSRHLNH